MFGQAPAEADMQRHFRVSPPSVHQMILALERDGFIRRRASLEASISCSLLTNSQSSNGFTSTIQILRDEVLILLSQKMSQKATARVGEC